MSAVTVGDPVMRRRNLKVGIQDAEAELDVRQALVARDGFSGGEVRGFEDQRKLAIEELGLGDGIAVEYLEARH